TGASDGIGSTRHAENLTPAGGGTFSRTSDQSKSTLRPSIAAPAVCCTNGGTALLLHATASKNQYVLSVRAAIAESRQWLAEKKYGVLLDTESFSSWPVQRYVKPSSCVNSIAATAFVLSTNAGVCGDTHATSISQAPEVPMSSTAFVPILSIVAGATTWCDMRAIVSGTSGMLVPAST